MRCLTSVLVVIVIMLLSVNGFAGQAVRTESDTMESYYSGSATALLNDSLATKVFASASISFHVVLECGFVPADGGTITLLGLSAPFAVYSAGISDSGSCVFAEVETGSYQVTICVSGYETHNQPLLIAGNMDQTVILEQMRFKPDNLYVDDMTLLTTWSPSKSTVVTEDFESGIFPPAGWQITTQGSTGWFLTSNAPCGLCQIPPHTTYAYADDDAGGSTNNGCCDYLITPELDLTNAEDYKLNFTSFFLGDYGQMAFVEISVDSCQTWTPIFSPSPAWAWITHTVDLSQFSGSSGYSRVWIAFHSDDGGNWASGWGVDDVRVVSESVPVEGYAVFLDGTEVGQTQDTIWNFDPATLNYGQTYLAGVSGKYCLGYSEPDTFSFTNKFLYPPLNLVVIPNGNSGTAAAIISWQPPQTIIPAFTGYNIYRNGELLINLSLTDTSYWDCGLLPQTYCYSLAGVYDLTSLGFPGETAESPKVGPICADVTFGLPVPFMETWSSAQFDLNHWTVGENWVIEGQQGNAAPAVKFQPFPQQTNYESFLESYWLDGTLPQTSTLRTLWVDYDISMNVFQLTGKENLRVELWDGSDWIELKEYSNSAPLALLHEHIELAPEMENRVLKIRFKASGDNSGDIEGWLLDNISLSYKYDLNAPENLTAQQVFNYGQPQTQLHWEPPLTGNRIDFILDDGTYEDGIYLNSVGEYWIGNKFDSTGSGVLTSASVYLESAGAAIYSIDVFDENHSLIGSSNQFEPLYGNWKTVELPLIPCEGNFFIMVHATIQMQSGVFPLDNNGVNAASNPAWFFDGNNWMKLSSFGYQPSVFFVRAQGISEDKHRPNQQPDVLLHANQIPENFLPGSLTTFPLREYHIKGTSGDATQPFKAAGSMIGYAIYRRNVNLIYPWLASDTTAWEWIATTTETQYLDTREGLWQFGNMLNEYYLTAIYDEGVSDPSNVASALFYEQIGEGESATAKIYPNPADGSVRLEFDDKAEKYSVYTAEGQLICKGLVHSQTFVILDTQSFVPGVYYINFTGESGYLATHKLLIMR